MNNLPVTRAREAGPATNRRASICSIDCDKKPQATSLKRQAPSAATLCHIDTKCRGATKRVYKNLRIHGTISF